MAGPHGARGEGEFSSPVEADITSTVTVTPSPTPSRAAVTFRTVTVVVAGAPQQGPNVPIPDGFAVVVKPRSTQLSSNVAFVANSAANTAIAASRGELKVGEFDRFFISNMNLLFFDANANNTVIELFAEQ